MRVRIKHEQEMINYEFSLSRSLFVVGLKYHDGVDGGGWASGMFINPNSGRRDIMSLRIKRVFYLVT